MLIASAHCPVLYGMQEVDDSDSESSTTESGGNAFEMRQWGADEGVEGPAPDSDEEALPLWEQDPADFEELSEVRLVQLALKACSCWEAAQPDISVHKLA